MNYRTNQRILVPDKPVNGEFMLLDLRGKVIVNIKFARLENGRAQSIHYQQQ